MNDLLRNAESYEILRKCLLRFMGTSPNSLHKCHIPKDIKPLS